MKKLIPYILPEWNCVVRGAILVSSDPFDLGEDMLEVSLPNGMLVAAGWYPEGDSTGEYVVTITKGLRHVLQPFETLDADVALQAVLERVSDFYYRGYDELDVDTVVGKEFVFEMVA